MRTGRPTRYDPDFVRQARILCRHDADIADLAQAFSVSPATIYRWQQNHHDFALAWVIGRAEAAGIAAPGPYRRATGYEYRAGRRRGDGSTGGALVGDTMRLVPADPIAALRWLRNRRPDRWRIGNQAAEPSKKR